MSRRRRVITYQETVSECSVSAGYFLRRKGEVNFPDAKGKEELARRSSLVLRDVLSINNLGGGGR